MNNYLLLFLEMRNFDINDYVIICHYNLMIERKS